VTGWLPAAVELEAYEGLRRGDEAAFRRLAEPLQPPLRRLAGLYVPEGTATDELVLRAWGAALRGLDMFRWHSPLATWIAGIAVGFGRTQDVRAAPSDRTMPRPAGDLPGPADWSDLPWSARWERAGVTLTDTLAALPTPELEVLHGSDGEQWPARRVCDVFGLPEVAHERLLADAEARLHAALAMLVGHRRSDHHDAQVAAIRRWLGRRVDTRPVPLDPRLVTVFRQWSATRRTRWRRFGSRRSTASR
jgi:DNA-directed RNA polymerase specialized sigma24 family protein